MEYVKKYVKCPKCGFVYPVLRKAGRDRPSGHLKSQWCVKCKERVNHIELDESELKFSLGNADIGGGI